MFRPYQTQAFNEILASLSNGENPLLHLDTGAGKTVVFCELLKRIHSKNKRAVMVVRGRSLVDQASQRLTRESVPHGVLMAGDYRYRLREPIQVASVDTLISRNMKPEADLIVVDESHLSNSTGYKRFLSQYDCPILQVTATPYSPPAIVPDRVIRPITFTELVNQGYLVAPKYYCPSLPDLRGVKSTKEDYNQSELGQRMNSGSLIGDLVHHYVTLAPGRKALIFAVTRAHAHNIQEIFGQAGIKIAYCDAENSMPERLEIIEQLRTGAISGIVNVGVMGLGVDIPWVDCIIMARPTKSLNLHLQQLGRGTRPYPSKENFLVLDHSGNVLRHGFAEEEREAVLTTEQKRPVVKSPTTCLKCYAVFYSSECPACGNKNPLRLRVLSVKDGELKEIKALSPEQELDRYVAGLKKLRRDKGYKRGWLWFELKRTHGEEVANHYCSKRPDWIRKRYVKT